MTRLASVWDGAEHDLVPDEHFPAAGARTTVKGWDELEEEDELSPFESPSVDPLLFTAPPLKGSLPGSDTAQAWGALSVTLGAFAEIIGVKRHQYQQTNYTNKTTRWTFQTDEFVAERI